jgi:hypothetical protein
VAQLTTSRYDGAAVLDVTDDLEHLDQVAGRTGPGSSSAWGPPAWHALAEAGGRVVTARAEGRLVGYAVWGPPAAGGSRDALGWTGPQPWPDTADLLARLVVAPPASGLDVHSTLADPASADADPKAAVAVLDPADPGVARLRALGWHEVCRDGGAGGLGYFVAPTHATLTALLSGA